MAILKDFQADALRVRVSDSREAMGRDAARAAGECIRALLGEREIVPERVRFIFTRSLPVNDTEQAQIVRELHGIVPDEQLLPQLSFLRDFRPDASQR